jgi:poly-gamma-glutamate capsule biosynthesis protein CapA/YwtB (metallophosphatase superfamily)
MSTDKLTMYAVGDCAPFRDDLASSFIHVSDMFKSGDIVFGQLESVLSSQLELSSCTRFGCSSRPEVAKVMKEAGFNVISFASNHALDYGRTAFKETLKHIREAGLYLTGAGENEEIARKYPIIDIKGTRIAVLGYGSILPQGFWAEEARPGVNPARGVTAYAAIEHDQPGTPCRIFTFPHPDDLKHMIEDIQEAKKNADVVIVSIHWGIHFVKGVIADYQRYYAHFAIDAGADVILGHHAHVLKPIEIYNGKVIFNSLSNFAMEEPSNMSQDQKMKGQDMATSRSHKEMMNISADFATTTRFFPMDSYMTMIAKIEIKDKGITKVSYLPAYLPVDCAPYVLKSNDPMFKQINEYMIKITKDQDMDTGIYKVEGDEVTLI